MIRKALDKIAGAKRKSTREKIGARVGRILQKYKMGKFVKWEAREGRLNWHFDEEKIAAELLLDGCYVITTDAKPDQMDSANQFLKQPPENEQDANAKKKKARQGSPE